MCGLSLAVPSLLNQLQKRQKEFLFLLHNDPFSARGQGEQASLHAFAQEVGMCVCSVLNFSCSSRKAGQKTWTITLHGIDCSSHFKHYHSQTLEAWVRG